MVIEKEKVMNSALFSGIQAEEMSCLLGCIGPRRTISEISASFCPELCI